jgi:hypothetical protein
MQFSSVLFRTQPESRNQKHRTVPYRGRPRILSNQAIAVDPNYGLANSGLAFNYVNQDDWFMPPNEAAPTTKDAAKRARARSRW